MFKKRNKILIIDDATELAESLAILFETHDFEVQLAHNGKFGFKKLESYTPDLIILDMDMPVMGGIEFYHQMLDQNNGICPYPVLVFTGRETLESVFKDLAVDGFLTKPFDFEVLLKKVIDIFQERYGRTTDTSKAPSREELEEDLNNEIFLFESDKDELDRFVLVFGNEGFKIMPGITNPQASYAVIETDAVNQIQRKKPCAIFLRLPSLNPLHEDYLLIHKILNAAKKINCPTFLYLKDERFFNDDVATLMCQSYCVKKVLPTSDPYKLFHEASCFLKHQKANE